METAHLEWLTAPPGITVGCQATWRFLLSRKVPEVFLGPLPWSQLPGKEEKAMLLAKPFYRPVLFILSRTLQGLIYDLDQES